MQISELTYLFQILQLCLLVILGLGHCQDEVPSRIQIETSINRTIEEVERMIKEDPKLPRLSRSEIVDILFNITSKDVNSYEDEQDVEKARMEYQRALMVVLPYSPDNSSHENLKDLYTKPPMVQMISDSGETGNIEMVYEDDGEMEEIVYPEEPREPNREFDTFSNNFVVSENVEDTGSEKDDTEESTGSYENHREIYSEVVDPIDFKTFSSVVNIRPIYDGKPRIVHAESPDRFNFNLNNLQAKPKTTSEPVIASTSEIPEEFEDSVSTDSKLQIVYSTTVSTARPLTTKFTTKVNSELSTEPTSASPVTTHRHVLTSDQWHYNAPPQTTTDIPKKVYPEYKFHAQTPSPGNVKPQGHYDSVNPSSSTTKRPNVEIKIEGQNNEKKHQDGMQYFKAEEASPVYVTPMSSNSTNQVKNKFSSSYAASGGGISKVSATMPPMRSEMKDLLASIGLSEGNPDKQPKVESKLPISGSSDLTYGQVSGLETTGVDTPSILSQNTFGSANYDYKKGTQNLTPDMQLLFQAFGLQNSKETATAVSTTTKKPTPVVVNLNSYSSFRPLPTTNVENRDMRDFLAKFGLGTSDGEKTRDHKSIKTKKNSEESPPSLIEAVPDNMKKILENIGLISRSQKSVELKSTTAFLPVPSPTPKLHVFKPYETPIQTKDQKEKINKLLDTVRKVQLGTADSHDVQVAAKDLLETTKTLQSGPDPLSLEDILNIYNEGIKNEVKRQEEVTTTTTSGDSSDTSTPLATGIQKLILYVLGSSQFWVGKMIQGLTRMRIVLTKAFNKLKEVDGD